MLKTCAREHGLLQFTLTMVIIIIATIIYDAEKNVEEMIISSIPEAFWYTIANMTTLG